MTSLLEIMLPANFLVYSLNAAVASVVACAIAVVLSRRQTWSLPARHAILVAAIAASLLAPLVMPLVPLPSLWAISVSEAVYQPLKSVETKPAGSNHEQEFDPELPTTNSIPRAEPSPIRPEVASPAVASPASVALEPIMPTPSREHPALSASDRARLVGTLVCGIWLVGIAVGMVRSLICLAKLRRWSQSVTVAKSPELTAAARSAAAALGLRQEIVVYCSNLLPAPITCGLLRPRIVVPVGIEWDLSPEQLRAVIKHEMAHLARRDLWIGLLQQVAQVIHWWNPLVYLANRQVADLREQICDDIAIRELPQPTAYAATLLKIAEQCSLCTPVPATLGFGSSPARQLESRIRRIVSSPRATCIRLSRKAAIGVLAVAATMTATILFAQVQIKSTEPGNNAKEVPAKIAPAEARAKKADQKDKKSPQDPSLQDLIQQMAAYERMYLPYDIKVMETFRFPDDLTPQEKARNLRADGRKHQRLMEYAQVTSRIWRDKETDLVDDEIEQGPYERFSDGERIIQVSPSSVTINGVAETEYHINSRKNQIPNYLQPTPLCGILCLASFGNGELFSQAFKDEEGVELAWDKGDAKLTFGFGKPSWNTKFVLWLSRDHAWHPIRLQRYWDAKDELFFDEWEVTKFAQRGKDWRAAEGTHRYRELKGKTVADPKIKYSMDFKVLEEKYGSAVNEKQFQITIPAGAKVHDDKKPGVEPPPPAKTREIKVTVVNVAGAPIPGATVRLPRWPFSDLDLVTTDDQGVARSAKAPVDDVSVQIAAAGFRPVTWVMGDVNELKATMVPQSPGVVVYRGQPVADAWITNRSLQIRADGYTYVPARDWDGRDDDWSDDAGRFELKSNLTVHRRDAMVPLIAINPNRDKMAISFVPAGELGKQQELALQSVCHVHGHCLLQGMPQSVEVGIGLETSTGQSIGWLSTRRELTPEGLRVDFEVRLPPGAYVLKTPQSSHHSGFTIPVVIPVDKEEFDLGTKTVPAAGAVALRGKPAPELDVEWRPGQEVSWEKLRGKVVVLDFWGTWCGPCVAGMPTLMEIHDQFKGKPVEWLSIHTPNLKRFIDFDEELAKCQARSWTRAIPFQTMIDRPLREAGYSGKTSELYGVAEWPTLIVVDQQGKVVGPVNKKKLADTISQLLDKKDAK